MVVMRAPKPWAPFAVKVEERVLIPDYSKAGAELSLRESMERMGLKQCHTLRMHDPDSVEGAMNQAVGEGGLIAGLRLLREEGKIVHVSFGMNANSAHNVITPGAIGDETTAWPGPQVVIDMIKVGWRSACIPNSFLLLLLHLLLLLLRPKSVPSGTFDSALIAYGWNLLSQDGFEVYEECHRQVD
jgi:hypothetical protein